MNSVGFIKNIIIKDIMSLCYFWELIGGFKFFDVVLFVRFVEEI